VEDRVRAVAHLLRNINSRAALAENAVVRELWEDLSASGLDLEEAIEHIREIAITAIDDLEGGVSASASRAAAIVRRCDVEGGAPNLVAAEFAISPRTFRRRRVEALNFILDEIRSRCSNDDDAQSVGCEPLDIRLQGAFLLALGGRTDEAVRHLVPVLDQLSGVDRVHVACVLAEFRISAVLVLEARTYLQCAVDAGRLLDGDARRLAFARIAYVEALLADSTGAPFETPDPLDTHIAWLSNDAPARGIEAYDLLGSLSALATQRRIRQGRSAEALRLFSSTSLTSGRTRISLQTRADRLMTAVNLRTQLPQRGNDFAADCSRLAHFARSVASPRISVYALASRARLAATNGDDATAEIYIHEALALTDTGVAPASRASIFALAAYVALLGRRPRQALSLARRARNLASPGTYVAVLAALREAEALQGIGTAQKSSRIVDALKNTRELLNHPQLLGQLLRIDAVNFQLLGDGARARAALADSVDILRTTEHHGLLAESLQIAGHLFPNNRFATEALEIQGASREIRR
jgi:hypothetical protein